MDSSVKGERGLEEAGGWGADPLHCPVERLDILCAGTQATLHGGV